MAFRCAKCGAGLSVGQIDFEKRRGACQACGIVSLDLAPSNASVPQLSKGRTVPNGLSLTESVGPDVATFVIRAPMSYTTPLTVFSVVWFALSIATCIASTMPPSHESGPGWRTDFDPPPRGLAILVLLAGFVPATIAYRSWVRRTTITLSAGRLRATQTPGRGSTFEMNVPVLKFAPVRGPVEAYVNENALHSWTVHCEAEDGIVRPLPITVGDTVQAEYLCARLTERLQELKASEPVGYRISANVPTAQPAASRLAKPDDLVWTERLDGNRFEVIHEPQPLSAVGHLVLPGIVIATGSAPFWMSELFKEGTQFGVAIACLFAPICLLVYAWRVGTRHSTLSCGPDGISVTSRPWSLRSMGDRGRVVAFKVLHTEPSAFARIAAETTDGRTVKIPFVLVVAGHEDYVVERLNSLLLEIRLAKS